MEYLTLEISRSSVFKKIARDLYCYYGVSEEDIKEPDKKIFFTGNGIEFIIQNFK